MGPEEVEVERGGRGAECASLSSSFFFNFFGFLKVMILFLLKEPAWLAFFLTVACVVCGVVSREKNWEIKTEGTRGTLNQRKKRRKEREQRKKILFSPPFPLPFLLLRLRRGEQDRGVDLRVEGRLGVDDGGVIAESSEARRGGRRVVEGRGGGGDGDAPVLCAVLLRRLASSFARRCFRSCLPPLAAPVAAETARALAASMNSPHFSSFCSSETAVSASIESASAAARWGAGAAEATTTAAKEGEQERKCGGEGASPRRLPLAADCCPTRPMPSTICLAILIRAWEEKKEEEEKRREERGHTREG